MIKIPGTKEWCPRSAARLRRRHHVNTTLLVQRARVSRGRRGGTSRALRSGTRKGGNLARSPGVGPLLSSRASTTMVRQAASTTSTRRCAARPRFANAKVAYGKFHELVNTPRWKKLAAAGAHPQRLLWASTGTKNPAYPKLMYVEQTDSAPTRQHDPGRDVRRAPRSRGRARSTTTLGSDLNGAQHALAAIEAAGVSISSHRTRCSPDGVKSFEKSFDTLLAAVADKRAKLAGGK